MITDSFDREWTLTELLDTTTLQTLGPALRDTLGGDAVLLDAQENVLWGTLTAQTRRAPIIIELESIGFLGSQTATEKTLQSALCLLHKLLRTEIRYRMASTLHVEAIAADFESLKREHAHLLESEARYKALSAELEKRVQAQVGELEERQQMLYEAEKLASVGQLAAGMAHEINNPLSFVQSNLTSFERYINLFSQLKPRLKEGDAAWQALDLDFILADSTDLLQDSIQGIKRIARIINDLKIFSNVDRSTEEYIDINTCLERVANVAEVQLPSGIKLDLQLRPLPGVICLPGHLNQLFFSLLRNATQAIEDSGHDGVIHISSEANEAGITIKISDNGIGISSNQLDRVFEPFYTTRPVGTGAGLGLSTARNIAMAHSGRLELTSQPNVGTTATLFIPTAS